jgi:AP-3 complex subunit delta-1
MDVIIRVSVIRPFAIKNMVSLLHDSSLLGDSPTEPGGNCEVLNAAAWTVGEFALLVDDPVSLTAALLQPRVASYPGHIVAAFVQATLKLLARALSPREVNYTLTPNGNDADTPADTPLGYEPTARVSPQSAHRMIELIQQRLPAFSQSTEIEVQERACFVLELIQLYLALGGEKISEEFAVLFDEPLNPVAAKSQKKVIFFFFFWEVNFFFFFFFLDGRRQR